MLEKIYKVKIHDSVFKFMLDMEGEGQDTSFERCHVSEGWDMDCTGLYYTHTLPDGTIISVRNLGLEDTEDGIFRKDRDKKVYLCTFVNRRFVLEGNFKEFGEEVVPLCVHIESGIARELNTAYTCE